MIQLFIFYLLKIFISIKNIRRKCNTIINLSNFTFNKKIFNEIEIRHNQLCQIYNQSWMFGLSTDLPSLSLHGLCPFNVHGGVASSYLRLINHGGQWTLKKLIYKMNGRQNARVYSISSFNLMERVRNPFNKMLHLHKIFTTFVLFFYFILSFLLTSGDQRRASFYKFTFYRSILFGV